MRDDQLSRRRFVETAGIAAGALSTVQLSRVSAPVSDVKIGLYSITYGGVWYRGDALTLEQVIERAKKFGYQGVEIDGKRPHGNPLDMPKARCQQLRKLAHDQGVEGYAGFELCHPLPVVNGQTVGLEFVDKNAQLAAEYMRGIRADAKKQHASQA